MTQITTITIDSKLLDEIENNRGETSRSRYITKLLEFALRNQKIITIKMMPVDNSFEAKDQQAAIVKGVN